MSLLAEGIYPCVVTSASYGEDAKTHAIKVQVNVTFTDGPSKGRFATYEDEINNKSALYVARSLKSIGWKGKLTDLPSDVAAFVAATGGKTTAEVKHIPIKNGARAGQIWDKVNSLGRGPRPLKEATGAGLSDAMSALNEAMALDGDDAPTHSNVAGNTDGGERDDIPFVSSAFNAEPSTIAKVLR